MRATLLLLALTVALAFSSAAGALTPQPSPALKKAAADFSVILRSGSAQKICTALAPYPKDPNALGTNRPRCLMLMKLLAAHLQTAQLKVIQMTPQPYGNWAVTYSVVYTKPHHDVTTWSWLFLSKNGKYRPASTV